MFTQLKAYLMYMVYGLLLFFFVVVTPGILRSIFYSESAVAEKKYDKSTLQKVDKTIKLFNFLASPLSGYTDESKNQGVISELAVTAVIYMFVAMFIVFIFYKFFLPQKRKEKPLRKM